VGVFHCYGSTVQVRKAESFLTCSNQLTWNPADRRESLFLGKRAGERLAHTFSRARLAHTAERSGEERARTRAASCCYEDYHHKGNPAGTEASDPNGTHIFWPYSTLNSFIKVQICLYWSPDIQHPIPYLYPNSQIAYLWPRYLIVSDLTKFILSVFESKFEQKYENKCSIGDIHLYPIRFRP
jgi:hypothetical protein